MAEYKLFEGDIAPFTDDEFYREREAAHHMEQEGHRERLLKALEYAFVAKHQFGCETFSDLGCGDGGWVQAANNAGLTAWGYDMQPSNVEYARNVRSVDVRWTNFEKDASIQYGDCVVMTEVLEHVSDPHGILAGLPSHVIIVSSPFHETDENHYEFHNWAWDMDGYAAMVEGAGFYIVRHEKVWLNQVILGVKE
jgi:2-polyprenyl-3-methyl-5-hydroxy-6-metoxy-1,4-benzoquinol methylase